MLWVRGTGGKESSYLVIPGLAPASGAGTRNLLSMVAKNGRFRIAPTSWERPE
jgi:hypothetical protein